MFELKPLSPGGIDAALEKAERYRLLNEPWEAESICLDVLNVDPGRQEAVIMLLLALTDQFGHGPASLVRHAREVLYQISDDYQRAYYEGILCERQGKALLDRQSPGAGPNVYEWIRDAMDCYEKAAAIRPPGNDDALLRWNTCVRVLDRHPDVRPGTVDYQPLTLE
ncbi:MAG TPA: hypothetical protein VL484_14775 [Vicinamibacterales bacterium]|jgi:hypothetical protein|nr:hypothetical protein [Vicinamibacterales bacterium]